ncbi:hypothetical protein AUJ84_01700 [Candidatus Pacearchaeota archaeon CG1_02_32_132]|nr:MAG: hypothetical protein AUJ84_01700 [Candidatus Pacearchaeota archaeon CG1_02_32_132]
MKRGQISVEYLIVIGFVVFMVLTILGVAFVYSSSLKDSIKFYQLDGYANKIISGSESVFFAGEPSRVTITAYLPTGVKNIEVIENSIVVTISTSSGETKTSYLSDVPISGMLGSSDGVKVVHIVAVVDGVVLSD